ncbi:MAG: hypothetical protein LBJ12_08685 [Oscillospiraceae bacterium]|jgi:hypothetical protein|nr:hypothetical protein [Oscillospiraceae bacterium]
MKHMRKPLAAFLAALFALSTFAAAAFGVAAASSRVSKNTDFIALNDPLEAFERLSSFGVEFAAPSSKGFPEEFIDLNRNHLQGVARYGEYTIVTLNNRDFTNPGHIFFFDSNKLLGYFQAQDGAYPSGIGVAGDYLVVSAHGESIYDISSLKDGRLPSSEPIVTVTGTSVGGLCNGATIVPYGGGQALLYGDFRFNVALVPLPITADSVAISLSTDLSGMVEGQYTEHISSDETDWGVQNCALVSDTAGNAWMFILACKIGLPGKLADAIGEDGVNYEDAATLYKIEISGTTAVVTGPYAEKKLESFDSYMLALGSHYRFAASVQVLDADNFAIVSTPSVPGNMFLDYVSGTARNLLDLVRPNLLPVNANVTRPLHSGPPASTANIEHRSPLNWLYQVLYWFLTIVKLDYFLGKFGINV